MAVLTIAAFISKWGTTNFPSTGNRSITAAKMRDFRQDIADSFQSVLGATTITSWKSPCVVATTANISLTGEQTIDGVLTSTSRVLVKNQTTTSQNGIYVTAAGAWSRSTDADSAGELEGAAVAVTQGTTLQNTIWSQTTDSITLGTSAIAWQQVGYATATNVLDEDDMASDSPTEPPSQQSVKAYVDGKILSTTITISSAEILALNTTPKELIPAPGASNLIELIGCAVFYDFVSAAYNQGAGLLAIRYNGSGINSAQLSNVINQTADACVTIPPLAGAISTNDIRNLSVVLTHTSADPTTGDGSLKIKLTYAIHTLP